MPSIGLNLCEREVCQVKLGIRSKIDYFLYFRKTVLYIVISDRFLLIN